MAIRKIIFILLFLAAFFNAAGQDHIELKDVANHIGDSVTVCDIVTGGKFVPQFSITVLDMGGTFPNQLLTLIIRAETRKKLNFNPEEEFQGKRICVSGKIFEYLGRHQIFITDPRQLALANKHIP